MKTFMALVFMLLSACATKPGNPAYSWLNGTWVGYNETGNSAEANFQVVNGNEVIGNFVYTRSTGRVWHGTITSGSVKGKEVNLFVRYDSGQTPEYHFSRDEEGILRGSLYHSTRGSGILMKAKK